MNQTSLVRFDKTLLKATSNFGELRQSEVIQKKLTDFSISNANQTDTNKN